MQPGFTSALLDPSAAVPEGLIQPGGAPAAKRFNVYRNNVVTSLIEALAAGFPTVRALVGEAFFDGLAGVFERQHPPTSPIMTQYGAALPGFLERFPPAQQLPYLADVAWLELLTRESLHARDITPDPSALATLPPERLGEARLSLLPSVRTLSSPYPVLSIALAATGRGEAKPPSTGEDCLILRPDMTVTSHILPAGGMAFIGGLQTGQTLGAAAAALPAGSDLSATLTLLLTAGAIGSATLP